MPENLSPECLSIAFASAECAKAREAAEALLNGGAACAVVTMGVEGSLATDGCRFATAPALPVTPLDTTGAGDNFIAAFLKAHVSGADLESALQAGAEHARRACLHLGGFPQEPLQDAGRTS
jgi:fructoselysine 6-kinase